MTLSDQRMLNRRRKLILVISFVIWVVSIYSMVQFSNEIMQIVNGQAENEQKWMVQPGDIIGFETFINSNNTSNSIVDKIISEYKYDECEKDVWGDTIIRVRAKSIPTEINITKIAEQIINLSGPVQVEQEINRKWELKNITLPFFIPIGFWDNLTNEFKKILPAGAIVNSSYSWVDEYSYTIQWTSGNFSYYVWNVWEKKDGVLQATIMNVTDSNGNTDSLEMRLCILKMKYEYDNLFATLQKIGLESLLFIGFVSFPVACGYMLRKVIEEKKKEKEEKLGMNLERKEEISLVLEKWNDIANRYVLIWFGFNIVSFVLGLETFTYLINIADVLTSKSTIYAIIFISAMLSGIFAIILYLYMARFNKYINKEKTYEYASEITPVISFMLGFASIVFGGIIGSIYTIPTIAGKMIMSILFISLVFTISIAYYVLRPWKDTNSVKKDLEDILRQYE